jgi:hypothetical protein
VPVAKQFKDPLQRTIRLTPKCNCRPWQGGRNYVSLIAVRFRAKFIRSQIVAGCTNGGAKKYPIWVEALGKCSTRLKKFGVTDLIITGCTTSMAI